MARTVSGPSFRRTRGGPPRARFPTLPVVRQQSALNNSPDHDPSPDTDVDDRMSEDTTMDLDRVDDIADRSSSPVRDIAEDMFEDDSIEDNQFDDFDGRETLMPPEPGMQETFFNIEFFSSPQLPLQQSTIIPNDPTDDEGESEDEYECPDDPFLIGLAVLWDAFVDTARLPGGPPSRYYPDVEVCHFDKKEVIENLLHNPKLRPHMHFGLQIWKDVTPVTELWEANIWGESILSTSGKFAVYPCGHSVGKPLLPLDFVTHIVRLSGKPHLRPITFRHELLAEAEIRVYGREALCDLLQSEKKILSVPTTTFADSFGAFRKTIFSILGVYTCPANIPLSMRRSIHYQFPLCLALMGISTPQVVETLASTLEPLSDGITTVIDGEEVVLYSFDIALVADMPQQNENCALASHRSQRSCRQCRVIKSDRGDTQYDKFYHGRYLHEEDRKREEALELGFESRITKALIDLGLKNQRSPWLTCQPAILPNKMTPLEPCHLLAQGIAQIMHELLVTKILIRGDMVDIVVYIYSLLPQIMKLVFTHQALNPSDLNPENLRTIQPPYPTIATLSLISPLVPLLALPRPLPHSVPYYPCKRIWILVLLWTKYILSASSTPQWFPGPSSLNIYGQTCSHTDALITANGPPSSSSDCFTGRARDAHDENTRTIFTTYTNIHDGLSQTREDLSTLSSEIAAMKNRLDGVDKTLAAIRDDQKAANLTMARILEMSSIFGLNWRRDDFR
ncbi:hypothetical protein K440DRAFT_665063 [Wilcoxina mikolae CBS 423.85]|nr:hypothetical protein K440DRAFT_665063 [Wilcoxina mikolae CBS 423.85]